MISHPQLKTNAVLTPKQAFLQCCAVAGIEVEIAQLTDNSRQLPERRKAESVLARTLAREGLQRHGVVDVEMERHADGFTLWPAGWAGSLAHSGGWCVAALARTASIGPDRCRIFFPSSTSIPTASAKCLSSPPN